MSETKELESVLKRVWTDLDVDRRIDFDLVLQILRSETENQEEPSKSLQALMVMVESLVVEKVK